MVSRAFSRCFFSDWYWRVRMLCRRSHSLMRITRTSWAMAMNILRRFSICSSSLEVYCIRVSLVTPSTRSATVEPKSLAMSSWEASVSSMQSWSRAAMMESKSRSSSLTISATARGWVM